MIAFVAALREEISGILRSGRFEPLDAPGEALAYRGAVTGGPEAVLLLTGTGGSRAEAATSWLVRAQHPRLVVSVGFAGGAREALVPGELVLASEVLQLEGMPFDWDPQTLDDPLLPDPQWLSVARDTVEMNGIDFQRGRIISLPEAARTSGLKRWLGSACGATVVDMESYRVGAVAAGADIPFLCVRAVVDTQNVDLPDVVRAMDGRPAGGRLRPALGHLARRPLDLPKVAGLGRAAAKARRSVTSFAVAFMREARHLVGPEAGDP